MSVIKLSPETVQTFKKMYSINQSLRILENETTIKTINESKTRAAYAQIKEKFPRDFCIYDLSEFISAMSIVNEPILDFSNKKFVVIKNEENSQRLKYVETDPDLITSYFERNLSLKSDDIEIDVGEDVLKAVMKSASTLRLEFIGFKADGEKVYFTTFNRRVESDDEEMNAFTVELGECEETFDIFYESNMLDVLEGDTKFTFCKNQRITKVDCGSIVYWIAMDKDSEIE
ncbi:MAG: hypothetical protein R3230_00635 [Nitrosopumilaceae archaeon]|nr:hypothetical protein [Nitrosopumilaceae archaeon]